jgi:hypothetical protein
MLSSFWRNTIGWSELLGGIVGYSVLGITAFQQPRLGIPPELRLPLLWYFMGALAFTFTIFAGVQLLRRRPSGIIASTVVQTAQLVQFSVPGAFIYQFVTGIQIMLIVDQTTIHFSPGVRAGFTALPPRVMAPGFAAINLFAVFAMMALLRAQSRKPEATSSDPITVVTPS